MSRQKPIEREPIERDRFHESSYNIRQIHENSTQNLSIFTIQLPSDPAEKLHDLIKSSFSAEQPVLQLSHDLSKELPQNAKITGSMSLSGQEFPISIKSDGPESGIRKSEKIKSVYYNNSMANSKEMCYLGDIGKKMEFEKSLGNSKQALKIIQSNAQDLKNKEKKGKMLGRNRLGVESVRPHSRSGLPMNKDITDKIMKRNPRMILGASPVNHDIKDDQLKDILIHVLAQKNYRKQELMLFFKSPANWKVLSEALKINSKAENVFNKVDSVLASSKLVQVVNRTDFKLRPEFYKDVNVDWKGYAVFGNKSKSVREDVRKLKEQSLQILKDKEEKEEAVNGKQEAVSDMEEEQPQERPKSEGLLGTRPDPIPRIVEPPVKKQKIGELTSILNNNSDSRPPSRQGFQIENNSNSLVNSPRNIAPIDPISQVLNRLGKNDQAETLFKKLEGNMKTAKLGAEQKYSNHKKIRDNRSDYKDTYIKLVREYKNKKQIFENIKEQVRKIEHDLGEDNEASGVELAKYYERLIKKEKFVENHKVCSTLLAEIKVLTNILKN